MSYLILDTMKEKAGLAAELSNQEAYGKVLFMYGLYEWGLEWIRRGTEESKDEINQMLFRDGLGKIQYYSFYNKNGCGCVPAFIWGFRSVTIFTNMLQFT